MFEMEPYQVRCRSCFSIFSYLNGFCPVCGGTGFVALEKSLLEPEHPVEDTIGTNFAIPGKNH